MNCREIEALHRDIVLERQTMQPETLPRAASEHLAACPRCSAQLDRERCLTASLAALAGSMGNSGALAAVPAAMEDRLRAAFREHWREAPNDLRLRSAFEPPARSRSLWAAAAAAIVVVSLGVMLLDWNPPGTIESPAGSASLAPSQGSTTTTGIAEPMPGASASNPSAPQSVPTAVRRPLDVPLPQEAGEAREVVSVGKPPALPSPGSAQAARQRPPQLRSEFVPLYYGGDPQLLGAGQIWRVEMPRGALQSVGVPVVEESRAGRIQVDILLGEDGIARAIRLVQ